MILLFLQMVGQHPDFLLKIKLYATSNRMSFFFKHRFSSHIFNDLKRILYVSSRKQNKTITHKEASITSMFFEMEVTRLSWSMRIARQTYKFTLDVNKNTMKPHQRCWLHTSNQSARYRQNQLGCWLVAIQYSIQNESKSIKVISKHDKGVCYCFGADRQWDESIPTNSSVQRPRAIPYFFIFWWENRKCVQWFI